MINHGAVLKKIFLLRQKIIENMLNLLKQYRKSWGYFQNALCVNANDI